MRIIICLLYILYFARGASIKSSCPESCNCQLFKTQLSFNCSSFDFLKTLNSQQSALITTLNINDVSLPYIDPKLKYLKNLETLNLSGNNITFLPANFPHLSKLKIFNLSRNHLNDISHVELPKNLQVIDLSYNLLTNIPKNWKYLTNLKIIYLENNPISCNCEDLFIFEYLFKNNVELNQATCKTPKQFQGKPVKMVNCSTMKNDDLLNMMLGDDNGSGDDSFGEPYSESDQDEFLKTDLLSSTHDGLNILEEGSGDEEGSGYLVPILDIPNACNFNCSTSKPVGANDEKDASPPPSVKEQFQIILEDIVNLGETTTIKVIEPESVDKEPSEVTKASDKEVEVFKDNYYEEGEMKRATLSESKPQTVYIIVGLLVAFVAFSVIYYVNNKKKKLNNSNKRNKPNENGYGEEMRTLKEPVVEKIAPNKPEQEPLLNGQNKNDQNQKQPSINDSSKKDETDFNDVELRTPNKEQLLTPQLERVTIRSSEIPDSVPKTPMLVHRQLNNDGEIVTTVIST